MSLETLYFISQLFAAAAVLASLIFLAIEVRRNTEESKRQSLEASTAHRSDFVRMISADEDLAGIIGRSLSKGKVTPTEWFRFSMFIYAIFIEFEVNHRKHKTGEMPDDLWQAWVEAYTWWLQFPGVKRWWAGKPAGFTDAFRSYIDGLVAKDTVIDEIYLAGMSQVGRPDTKETKDV